jgi:protein-S-isoprenylcysteine O-methyltransferase Ste14
VTGYGYGLWFLVVVNAAVFFIFAASQGDPQPSPFHLASYVFIGGGFWAIATAWPVLLRAARAGQLATTGLYARVRHPQYVGFLAIVVGFLLQWPTIPTLLMFPVLLVIYRRLSVQEKAVATRFGSAWQAYAGHTPRFVPKLGSTPEAHRSSRHDDTPAGRR